MLYMLYMFLLLFISLFIIIILIIYFLFLFFFFYLQNSVKLENCIVCNNGKVLEKCHLVNCEIAAGFVVPNNSKLFYLYIVFKF